MKFYSKKEFRSTSDTECDDPNSEISVYDYFVDFVDMDEEYTLYYSDLGHVAVGKKNECCDINLQDSKCCDFGDGDINKIPNYNVDDIPNYDKDTRFYIINKDKSFLGIIDTEMIPLKINENNTKRRRMTSPVYVIPVPNCKYYSKDMFKSSWEELLERNKKDLVEDNQSLELSNVFYEIEGNEKTTIYMSKLANKNQCLFLNNEHIQNSVHNVNGPFDFSKFNYSDCDTTNRFCVVFDISQVPSDSFQGVIDFEIV